jgi:hypothetical protein
MESRDFHRPLRSSREVENRSEIGVRRFIKLAEQQEDDTVGFYSERIRKVLTDWHLLRICPKLALGLSAAISYAFSPQN